MSTVLIVAVIVVFVALVAAFLYFGPGRGARRGSLRRRFGPEYDRVLARHDGDTGAAEAELAERVRRHGSLKTRPLTAETRERYVSRWAGLQEQFVDSPQQAVAEAGRLVGALAQERGFPAPEDRENHADALSVHHPYHVNGYRALHSSVEAGAGTEDLRAALLEARGLFGELVSTKEHGPERRTEPVRHRHRQKVLPMGHRVKGEGA
ncbi:MULTISPECIES: hypothetical protein [unclassified Streptomyces]|uniref:hypothetical protein n=1 Tax=unclassified Streptomyces TaxID=2593676 RepID=UPI002E144556|nr:hypothetical protein OG452_25625 [Streptomyces sp. NBC_01197]WSS48854.1 hypothetical protein OG708_09445 [Streptomyces sp. NBC_01180]